MNIFTNRPIINARSGFEFPSLLSILVGSQSLGRVREWFAPEAHVPMAQNRPVSDKMGTKAGSNVYRLRAMERQTSETVCRIDGGFEKETA
jgi:hypothetical protein